MDKMNDIAIVVVKPGLLSMGDIARLRKKGIAVVETDNFSDVKIIGTPLGDIQQLLLDSALANYNAWPSQAQSASFYREVVEKLVKQIRESDE